MATGDEWEEVRLRRHKYEAKHRNEHESDNELMGSTELKGTIKVADKMAYGLALTGKVILDQVMYGSFPPPMVLKCFEATTPKRIETELN